MRKIAVVVIVLAVMASTAAEAGWLTGSGPSVATFGKPQIRVDLSPRDAKSLDVLTFNVLLPNGATLPVFFDEAIPVLKTEDGPLMTGNVMINMNDRQVGSVLVTFDGTPIQTVMDPPGPMEDERRWLENAIDRSWEAYKGNKTRGHHEHTARGVFPPFITIPVTAKPTAMPDGLVVLEAPVASFNLKFVATCANKDEGSHYFTVKVKQAGKGGQWDEVTATFKLTHEKPLELAAVPGNQSQPAPPQVQPQTQPQPQALQEQTPTPPAQGATLPPKTRAALAREAYLMMGSVPENLLERRQFTVRAATIDTSGYHYSEGVVLVVFFLDDKNNIVQPQNFVYEVDGVAASVERCNEVGGYPFCTDYSGKTLGVNPGSRVRLTVNGTCIFDTQMPDEIGQGIWVVFTQKPGQ
jgi:hypothetical protein